ncbi:hypothetical protein KY290_004924 [Solanum tuberosum]|uniref:Bifunctional inhibitor/plant lipid transfer protein/seed storage helical domain-containing protein n=2 Tax=Solanum tuberosum TaxID=4113 RepID=A0ABQ7WCM5_SOLTU|nr:PREDICTED: non-specific lipid-transfer protein-like [Solanum tuberosum]KAH0778497.1 hypothetical protein KY290_004924 [Solanum tuberosum]
MAKIILTLFALALILGQTNGDVNGGVNCERDVLHLVKPCSLFVLAQDPKPSEECCVGLQSLAKTAAASQSDRKVLCDCIKYLEKFGFVNYTKAKQLPQLCHFTAFMPIEPNPDCS